MGSQTFFRKLGHIFENWVTFSGNQIIFFRKLGQLLEFLITSHKAIKYWETESHYRKTGSHFLETKVTI